MTDNSSLINGLKNGDEKALQLIFERYIGILLAYAKQSIRNPLLSEDFVQDAFCVLWENRLELNSELSVKSYLYKLVHHRCVDYLRKQKAQSNFTNDSERRLREIELTQYAFENSMISELFAREVNEIVRETIENFKEPTREIFRLSRNLHMKNAEIAHRKGLSVKAVEYHISKALEMLRNVLKDFL